MNLVIVGLSASTLFGMAIVICYILGWANKAFHVEVDPRTEAIVATLPGANCGGCGYVGCGDYADAVVNDGAPVDKCPVGGAACAASVASIMGVEVGESFPQRPIVHCGAHYSERKGRTEYRGEMTCKAANMVAGVQGCTYGCLGFGDCTRACKYDAIHIVDGLATVDYDKCIGCGACGSVCPRNIITITPFKKSRILAVGCSNKDTGKDVMAVCEVGCIGCKACARKSDLFKIVDNLPTIDYEIWDEECTPDVMAACEKCSRNRLIFVGEPSADDIAATADKELPEVVEADFKTTVDDTEWRG
ncbi:electron transporter RnfB [Desulfonema ishimotonii]|uniref:Ion-translocating oxidoreductase complex subunit B n=1 Tax=Desulfonema ishimotonii TaxID=45657 RepID=A0A401FY16_9BACT|nr:RnfABCDGE type electron transport complex subunit B [Desulfonema ishimotonii]GBC61868.1 electron transporter RnfB [Desulfonema ishimotonii]